MEQKTCVHCHKTKDITDFAFRNTAANRRHSRCKDCTREVNRVWYKNNTARMKQHVKKWDNKNKGVVTERLWQYLLDHPCACGESDPVVLDFDHDDPSTKFRAVAEMFARGCTWTTLLTEIVKCTVRCANCHRRRTAEQFGHWKHVHSQKHHAIRPLAA